MRSALCGSIRIGAAATGTCTVYSVESSGTPMASIQAALQYAELHCISNFSFLRGASHPSELVTTAAELGYAGLALTDECSVAGIVRAHTAAKAANFKLIVGSELAFPDELKVVLLAVDRALLCRVVPVDQPRAARSRKGLLSSEPRGSRRMRCGFQVRVALDSGRALHRARRAAHDGPLAARAIRNPGLDRSGALARRQRSTLAPGMARRRRGARHASRRRRQRAHALPRPPHVAGHADRHPSQDCRSTSSATRCIRTRSGACARSPSSRACIPRSCCARRSRSRARRVLARRAALRISARARARGRDADDPSAPLDGGGRATALARGCAAEGACELIEHELALIAELALRSYFLTVHDIVRFARSSGILCQGRGSAANSAVCFCLGITEVDPARM